MRRNHEDLSPMRSDAQLSFVIHNSHVVSMRLSQCVCPLCSTLPTFPHAASCSRRQGTVHLDGNAPAEQFDRKNKEAPLRDRLKKNPLHTGQRTTSDPHTLP